MNEQRISKIEELAAGGKLQELREFLGSTFSQIEIDAGLTCAIAYSHVEVGKYLLSLGGDLACDNNSAAYYAVHNNELDGLKFAIENGVDVNAKDGHLLNEAVVTAFNQNDTKILRWLLEHGADKTKLMKQTMRDFSNSEIRRVLRAYSSRS